MRVPWTARRSNQSILKETSPGYSFGRTDADAEAPMFWPHDAKSQLISKDPESGRLKVDEKGSTEDEMVGYLH